MTRRIVITGAAGLVGQNLVARLKSRPDLSLVGIDKHPVNTGILRRLHPEIEVIEADLAEPGAWMERFSGAEAVVLNQAQIGGLDRTEFERNNVTATERILEAMHRHQVSYLVHISSSVVNSKAVDFYTETKRPQEAIALAAGFPCVVLRPTLMFGWFDRKHLGWLQRFMARSPVFPIPGHGRYARQPLYVGDFAAVIAAALDRRTTGVFDISGQEVIDYVEIIRTIRDATKARARIVHIPFPLFKAMLATYALVDRNPPFTTSQLEALVIPETFPVIDWPSIFGVRATPFREAVVETFLDPRFKDVVLSF
jgi:nucleoside-diphosphate-sugar epimerase